MIYPVQKSNPLSLYILISVSIHLILLSFFNVLTPKRTKTKREIVVNISQEKSKKIATTTDTTTKSPAKIATANTPKTIPKPVAKIATANTPKTIPKPVAKIATANTPKTIPIKTSTRSEEMASELENLLNNHSVQEKNTADVLENAIWTGTPRKTLHFPNLSENIPITYQARGYGFSVTAKITFNPQGWVSSIELLHSSGDPAIDNIFRTELRKICIEESAQDTYDTIIKTFTISVK